MPAPQAEANAAQTSLRSLTDDYAKTQQYANSLQEYNNKLTADMVAHTAAMDKAVGDKAALMEEHAALKGAHTAATAGAFPSAFCRLAPSPMVRV